MHLQEKIRSMLRRTKDWINDETKNVVIPEFDNSYDWLNPCFLDIYKDPVCRRKPAYIWGCLQGVALAKVLGINWISIIEFGVASGQGLLALESISFKVEKLTNTKIDIYGFDTGVGLPKSLDYRDCPNLWLEGQFYMDDKKLRSKLHKSVLKLGLINDTVHDFINSDVHPIAFISFDVDLYHSTKHALSVLTARCENLLPRVICYFDDINGLTFSEFNGERLAIKEFNDENKMRKIDFIQGLKYFVPPSHFRAMWPDLMFFAHIFEHPLYGVPDQLRKPMIIDTEGKEKEWFPVHSRG